MDMKHMIGLNISEKEYRDLPYPSYSLLSDIEKNGVQIIDGVRNPDINELDGVMLGKLVDNLYTENKMPDNLHVIDKKPTGKAKEILKAISKYVGSLPDKTDPFGEKNIPILNGISSKLKYHKATRKYNFDDNDPDLIKKRIDGLSNYREYLELLTKIDQSKDNFIITRYLYQQGLKIVKALKAKLDLNKLGRGIDVIPQVQLVEKVQGIEFKGMLDFVIVDHNTKTITPYDLKTGSYEAKDFGIKGLYGWNYYLQASLYMLLLNTALAKHPIYKDYLILPFRFIFCGSKEVVPEIIETMPLLLYSDYLIGFKIYNSTGGYDIEKKGLFELIVDYREHKDKGKL